MLLKATYLNAADTNLGGNDFEGPAVKCASYEDIRFHVITHGDTHLTDDDNDPMTPDVSETTYPKGSWVLEASEDPQVVLDERHSTGDAKWVPLALSGDVTVIKAPGATGITVNAADVTLDGTAEANFLIKVKTPFTWLRLRWAENGDDIGTADVYVSGRGA